MPAEGKKQIPAGKVLSGEKKLGGTKRMKAVDCCFDIEMPIYKGNAVLNANRS